MSGEEATPIVENKAFPESAKSNGSSTTESSSPVSPHRSIAGASKPSKILEVPGKSPAISPETDMSASYHEIFDTQMPIPPSDHCNEDEEDQETTEKRLAPLLCCDNNTVSTTEYLTSKLVEDSLKWQKESKAGDKPSFQSPKESPVRKRPHNLSVDFKCLSLKSPAVVKRMDVLDPTAIEDVEKHARYLAACVDSMVENLSGVLQSDSALTVQTLETYRDGVCKTCDEVDTNIKSMYQLMAKVEELNKSMAPAYKIGEQVKELRKLVELYDSLI